MKGLVFIQFVALILLVNSAVAQTTDKTDCNIQALAIEAALGGNTAQYNLAVEFFKGACVERDYNKAANLWRKAADGGNIDAHNNLGFLTYFGWGVKQNFAEGIRLWRVAAEKGMCESQVHLAEAYSDGKHLKRDYLESYAWGETGRQCALNDDPDAKDAITKMADTVLKEITPKMSATQMSSAKMRAKIYVSRFIRTEKN